MYDRISDEDLLTLWKFSVRAKRLRKISKNWKRGTSIKMENLPNSTTRITTTGLSSDMRLSAALNELRPFMLSSDCIYFPKVRKKISKMYKSSEKISNLKTCKSFWNKYDLNNENSPNSAKMRIVFIIKEKQITSYKQLLKCFMYGRYFHNDDNSLFILENFIEENPQFYPHAKSELQFVIFTISSFLFGFNKIYVEPILKHNTKRIDEFKKEIRLV
ncbi:MAG: hypothetical protein Q4E70_01955 [Candidatus Saccharibacteria bacterium]|nr:hypothetical protein [Candidatus Saccharibacteria bacterium]